MCACVCVCVVCMCVWVCECECVCVCVCVVCVTTYQTIMTGQVGSQCVSDSQNTHWHIIVVCTCVCIHHTHTHTHNIEPPQRQKAYHCYKYHLDTHRHMDTGSLPPPDINTSSMPTKPWVRSWHVHCSMCFLSQLRHYATDIVLHCYNQFRHNCQHNIILHYNNTHTTHNTFEQDHM